MNRILITGASGGIGSAIAKLLAGPDSELIIHGRDRQKLDALLVEIEKKGGACKYVMADIGTTAGIEHLTDQIENKQLDVIIHNAGVAHVAKVEELSVEDWNESMAINVTAPFMITKGLLSQLNDGGSIIHILSVAAKTGFPGWSSYCASKFALDGFSQSLREELRPRKIRVINIYPSATDTEIWSGIPGDWNKENMLKPDSIAKAVKYALDQTENDVVENISLGNIGGNQ